MGLLNSLIESSHRFENDLLPIGFTERNVSWMINLSYDENIEPEINKRKRDKSPIIAPISPTDRTSSKVSPCLLVDKASYVLGIVDTSKKGDSKKIASKEHSAFLDLLKQCYEETKDSQVKRIWEFLNNSKLKIPEIKASDLIAFQIENEPHPTDNLNVQDFWSKYIEKRLKEDEQQCVICGQIKPITRILPFEVALLKGTDGIQLSSFNKDAFESLGKTTKEVKEDGKTKKRKSGANAAVCYSCASIAGNVLSYLVKLDKDNYDKEKNSGRHIVVLQRDRTHKKHPLDNWVTIFWTKEKIDIQLDINQNLQFEDLVKIPLEDFDEISENEIPVKVGQCRDLLQSPFLGGILPQDFPTNRFYLAILSPNITRLVIREWLNTDIISVKENIGRYWDSLQIIHPDGRGFWAPPFPALIEALQAYTSSKQEFKENPRIKFGPDVTKKLIRCIYTGTPPPETILHRAVRCFRIPDPPTENKNQIERQMLRRMSMAAAMKLILTYNKNEKEKKAMEQLKTNYDVNSEYKNKAPYNCGVLLAILEAIQRRASSSGKGVNTTLVHRYYATASTAPATVFANLISMATKAHLPKLQKENKEYFKVRYQEKTVNINDLIAETCKAIDKANGFPPTLEPKQQAEFALGFYHQRAEFVY